MTNDRRSRLAPIAQRARCTEGQLYTMVIGLVVALLLVTTGLPAAFRDVVGPVAGAATGDPTTSTTPSEPTTPTSLIDLVTDPSSPYFDPNSPLLPEGTAAPSGPGDPLDPVEEEPAVACDSQAALDVVGELLRTLNVLGVLPDTSVTKLLANVTGCKQGDPVILVMGVLAQLGSRIPDLGFDLPLLPPLVGQVPPELVAAVQPLRDVIDPVCGTVGSVSQVVFYGFAGWPMSIDLFTIQTLQQVLLLCGQLQT